MVPQQRGTPVNGSHAGGGTHRQRTRPRLLRHAQIRYVKHGKQTSEVGCFRKGLRPVRRLYGSTPAADFGPRALKDVRQALIDGDRGELPCA